MTAVCRVTLFFWAFILPEGKHSLLAEFTHIMEGEIERLKRELLPISRRAHAIKILIQLTADHAEVKNLQKELKHLQRQVLFYLEKIENLRIEGDG